MALARRLYSTNAAGLRRASSATTPIIGNQEVLTPAVAAELLAATKLQKPNATNFPTKPIHMWTKGVPVESQARDQLLRIAQLPIIHSHVAVMPDVHLGNGATVGSVIPCYKAIIPAAVGVDIGCGMIARRTSLNASDLGDSLKPLRLDVENAIPHGRTDGGGTKDEGAWRKSQIPAKAINIWKNHLSSEYERLCSLHPTLGKANGITHLGTLGTGNHFVELCLDESDHVWCMLHSGSRGVGNKMGMYFMELAKKDMRTHMKNLPDADLAYLKEGTQHFDDYVAAVNWAQEYARWNREIMMDHFISALQAQPGLPPFNTNLEAVNCHHNYVNKEYHFGEHVYVTRKGAVSAREGELGIIPGSMGARSYIVRGRGNAASFHSCSHGAGRVYSRGEAKRRFTLADHEQDTKGVECRKDAAVLDETPRAYKDIDAVLAAQSDLVEVVHTLKQIMCVKG